MGWKEWVPTIGIVGVVIAAVVWQNYDKLPEGPASKPSKADRIPQCRSLSGEPVDRLHACLADIDRSKLSKEAKEAIEDLGSKKKVFAIADIETEAPTLTLADHPELEKLLMATDEEAVAKALLDLDVRGLVVNRDLTGALDRDSVVLSRLAQHDYLEWFQLRHVTEDLMIY